jgi:hypothetical protein
MTLLSARDEGAAPAGATALALGEAAAPAAAPATGLVEALESWRVRLAGAGIACRAVALHGSDPPFCLEFPAHLQQLAEHWQRLRAQVHLGSPPQIARTEAASGGDVLLVTALQLPDGQTGVLGAALAAPHNERTVQLVLLALGWLQLALAAPRLARAERAGRLLELLGHVASQQRARAAAQEWINRTAGWAREEGTEPRPSFSLLLFEIRGERPQAWVTADAAWTEKASPTVQAATEVAMQALLEQQEILFERAWALPLLAAGAPVAVLVALSEGPSAGELPEAARSLLRASAGLAEPLLRQWLAAERPLWRHALDSLAELGRKLRRPGHLSWKLGAGGLALVLMALLALPVPDRVSANSTIEGRQRYVVTAPFDGFIGKVMVRPGDRVTRGQLLARLDERDLKLEQARYRSEHEQASGRLRQAMADHEAPAMGLALAEVQQAEAQLALVEAKLARAELDAPQDGLVVSGDWVQQIGGPVEIGKEMFEIASGAGYRVVLHVPDRDIARVRLGQPGVLRLAGQPNVVHAFRIAAVTATASVQDTVNGFRVEADWVGSVPELSPGMQGVGKIEVGRANLLTLWTRSSLDWLRLKLWGWWI